MFSRKEVSIADRETDPSTTRTSARTGTHRSAHNRTCAPSPATPPTDRPNHVGPGGDTDIRLLPVMHEPPAPPRPSDMVRSVPSKAGLFTIAVGALVLLGWILDITFLKSVVPGLVPMTPNTAFCFVFAGGALYVLSQFRIDPAIRTKLASGLALVPLTLGFITLLEHFFGRNLWIDNWLGWLIPTPFDGRMAALAGLNFVLLGGALTLADWVTPRGRPSQFFAL